MRLVRSWPSRPPGGRAYVCDDAPRVAVDDYDYRGIVQLDDDVLNLDWDIAVAREDLAEFASMARAAPERVLVAPYPIYPDTRPGLPGITWPMRRYDGDVLRYVAKGEPTCHLFGFGMTYLPRELIRGFADANPGANFDDTAFAGWHYRETRREIPIVWRIRPVHLNYRINTVRL
jgi:hypothetical protein